MDPIKFKTIITAMIITAGAILVVLVGGGTTITANQSSGIGIDFGERDVTWTNMDLHLFGDPKNALEEACDENDYTLTIDAEGTVQEINNIFANNDVKWGLWVVDKGNTYWTWIPEPDGIDLINYTISVWAYCSSNETPTIAVDQVGNSIYGFPQAQRTVTLSPSLTEIMGSLNAINTLVGTDRYSNYPTEVVTRRDRGDVTIIGDYLSPSFELIMKVSPDMVFCDGSQYSHFEMSEKLRKSNVNAIVMYNGESIDTILDNIFIMGVAMGYDLRALDVIESLEYAEFILSTTLKSKNTEFISTMVSLSADKAPWVAGAHTYIHDITETMFGENVFSSKNGWIHTNSEIIPSTNPSVIIILSEDYHATQEEYDLMLNSLSKEWQETDAYKNGRIYMICDNASEMMLRAGPRCAQIMELVARIIHTDSFTDITINKFIGNDYENYLTYTQDLGFQRN